MNIEELLKNRKSVRAYENKQVSKELIEEILEYARFTPSSTNTQPWKIYVVANEKKKSLENKILKAFDSGDSGDVDFKYYPDEFTPEMLKRQQILGEELYGLIGIKRDDKDARVKQWRRNYTSFDAPVSIYFFMDKRLQSGSFLDYGMIIQTIALLATSKGLSTCIQGALAQYPSIVRKELGISDDNILVCGMSLGYEDKSAKINSYRSKREKVEDFTKFYF